MKKKSSQKPSLGWQSWSPPFTSWHGYPRWDYSPFPIRSLNQASRAIRVRQVAIRYWCSWYAYGWNINHHKILTTLQTIKEQKLPFTHILIDDGWTTWGDWHTPDAPRFGDLKTTIRQIKSHRLKAGLWFAPFLASSKSCLYKEHSNWFISYRGKSVQGLKTFPVWDSVLPQQYLLNLELPEVKKYLTDFVDLAIKKWRVNLLKLDFLYAPYFNPHLKSDHLAHKQVVWLLSYIRNKYPHIAVVACGAPFSPSLGLVSAIRISKDTALPPVVPTFFNKIIYRGRVKMLDQKLASVELPKNIDFDPDVRMFYLDTPLTDVIWDTISTSIIGCGDKLTTLSVSKITKLKLWLTNHNSQ